MDRAKSLFLLVLLFCLAGFLLQPAAVNAEENDVIQAVKVKIVANPPAPPRILRRMEASVKTVGERVLTGREIELISGSLQTYEHLVQDVLDRVLAGYTVQKVVLEPGMTTGITVLLESWDEMVQDVQVESEFSAVDPLFVPLLKQELGDLAGSVRNILLGLPVNSLDWADAVAKNSIREIAASRLPEYRAAVDIIPGPHTQVKILFSPVGNVVRDVKVSLRSESMPNLLLHEMRPKVEEYAKALRGLPITLVERKQLYLTDKLETAASSHPFKSAYQLDVRGEMIPGADTDIRLRVDSRIYRVSAEAWLDMGRKNANTSGLLHAGKYVSPEDELYAEVKLITDSMKWQFSPGWGRRVGPDTVIGARFNVTDDVGHAWLEHRLGTNWLLRFDRSSAKDDDEIGLRYKLHDFLSAELVHRPKETFVRVVGHL